MKPSLAALRAEIDRIDDALLELLIERCDVVRRIGDVKAGAPALRPAREAQILRRLVVQAGERFPAPVVIRMWRELFAATTRLQGPLSVAVYLPAGARATWDLARDHFGATTPMTAVASSGQAIRAVADGSVAVAVLPLPQDDDPWWRGLLGGDEERLRVIAKLPFAPVSVGVAVGTDAVAVARIAPQESGDDATLLAIEAQAGVSRARLRGLLGDAGIDPSWLAVWHDGEHAFHLVEVQGFVPDGDPRPARALAAARGEVLRVVAVGGYAKPLAQDALS